MGQRNTTRRCRRRVLALRAALQPLFFEMHSRGMTVIFVVGAVLHGVVALGTWN